MIKPLEKNGKKIIYIKVAFLLVLFFLGVFLTQKVKKVEAPDVLGAKEEKIKNQLPNLSEKIKETIGKTVVQLKDNSESILEEVENKVGKVASQSSKVVVDYVFDTAVSNITKQIEKLPESQKEKIKEEVCK
jgi:mRNA-degrading endonuclease RelE of RelBE toxin-antitoxin system